MNPADDCGVTGGCRACPLFAANVCGDPAPEPCAEARFEVDAAGVVTDREADPWAGVWASVTVSDDMLAPTELDRQTAIAARVAAGQGGTLAWDVDAPDVDPAEPKPEGVGCCGGGCCG